MANKRFQISDESVNHYGYRILMSGGDLAFFLVNPVLFYNHFRSDEKCTVYGRWGQVELSDTALSGIPVFDLKDKEGRRLNRKVKDGFINACSIHIRPLEVSDDPALKLPGQTGPTVTKWQLKEVSIVDLPGNGNAVILCDEKGDEITPFQLSELISKPKPPTVAPSTMDDLKYLATTLGLRSDATLSDVNEAISALKSANGEVASLKLQLKQYQDEKATSLEAEATQLLDAAEKDGRITTASRVVYANALKADHESGKALLETLTPVIKLSEVTPGKDVGKTTLEGLTDGKYKGKTFDDLSRLNDGEDLLKLKAEKPETFAALFEAHYGKPYKNHDK